MTPPVLFLYPFQQDVNSASQSQTDGVKTKTEVASGKNDVKSASQTFGLEWILPILALATVSMWFLFGRKNRSTPSNEQKKAPRPAKPIKATNVDSSSKQNRQGKQKREVEIAAGREGGANGEDAAFSKVSKSERKKKKREIKLANTSTSERTVQKGGVNKSSGQSARAKEKPVARNADSSIGSESMSSAQEGTPLPPVESIFAPLKELAPLRIAAPKKEEPKKEKKNKPAVDKDGIVRFHRDPARSHYRNVEAAIEPTRPSRSFSESATSGEAAANLVARSLSTAEVRPFSPSVETARQEIKEANVSVVAPKRIGLADIVAKKLSTKVVEGEPSGE